MKVLIIILVVIGMLVASGLSLREYIMSSSDGRYSGRKPRFGVGAGLLAAVFLIGIVVVSTGLKQVGPGQRGVILRFGAVTTRILGEGLHMIVPVMNSVEIMDVTTQKYEEEVAAASKDLQDVWTTITATFKLNPANVHTIYQTLRQEYVTRIIIPSMSEAVKAAGARFTAEELITRRLIAKATIEEILAARLLEHNILLENIAIKNFMFSEVFTAAVESKVKAAQAALEAENKLRRVEVEAQQAKAEAQGKANALREQASADRDAAILRAEGEAQAIELRANAQAEANRVIALSLNDEVIRFQTVQKLADDINTMILPAGSSFILGPEVLGLAANAPVPED